MDLCSTGWGGCLNKAIVGSKQLGGWLRRMGDLVQVRSHEISGEQEKVNIMGETLRKSCFYKVGRIGRVERVCQTS